MYQFFVSPSQINIEEKRVIITGPDVNHIGNVLRMKPGEEVNISNGSDGREYRCAILEISDTAVILELRFIKEEGTELPVTVTLYQGLPKADKMELIIQKCVELGVTRIVPVTMKRCVVKLDDKKSASKIARWQSIAEAAAKQSKRGIIAEICPVMGYEEALKAADTLVDLTDVRISAEDAVSVISSLLKCELEIKECVPNEATAFTVISVKELRKALTERDLGLAYDIADILQALPEKKFISDKRSVSDFNKDYIKQFNKKHGIKLPLIV